MRSIPGYAEVSVLCLFALLGSCARSDDRYYGTTEPRHGPDEVWSNLSGEPEWIDPGKCTEVNGGTIIGNTFAGLTRPHPVTLEPMPDIAQGWRIEEEGRVFVFKLRPSQWSDGTPLTAHDFEFAWKRLLDRETASRYASFLHPLEYGADFNLQSLVVEGFATGTEPARLQQLAAQFGPVESVRLLRDGKRALVRIGGDEEQRSAAREALRRGLSGARLDGAALRVSVASSDLVGVRALDDLTLEVRLETPLPYFLDLVAYHTTMPVPRHLLARLKAQGVNEDLWTRTEHIVSNGAYTLKEWKFRQHMVLEKNPRYWDAEHVKLRTIRLAMVDSQNTTLNLYEAGELDYIGNAELPAEFRDHLRQFEDYRQAPYLGVYFFWLNTREPPLDDPKVRRALSLAVDREALTRNVTRGGQIPTADLVPRGLAGYAGLNRPLFDPVAAKALLAEAGYGPSRPLPPIRLSFNTLESHKLIAEALQAMWKQHLGIDVELENLEWKVYLKKLEMFDFQIARLAWIGDYPDPNTFLELLLKDNGNNHSHWTDPEFEALMQRANRTTDRAARLSLLLQAERLALAQTPLIPIYVYSRTEMIKPYLKGNWMNYQHHTFFANWWIDERYYTGVPGTEAADPPPPLQHPIDIGGRAP
jgi:oligopeptide transport system substrate-binding protein